MPWKLPALLACGIIAAGCGTQPNPEKAKPAEQPDPPKITLFYVTPPVLRDGQLAQLCYSVEGATKVSLDPPVDRVWPALSRCIEIKPAKTTKYTLTAENSAGVKVTASTEASIGPPTVKIIEVTVNSLEIHAGESFAFCVHGRNAKRWTLSAGQWRTTPDASGGCVIDHPTKSTTYLITGFGAMGETDSEHVTATVK